MLVLLLSTCLLSPAQQESHVPMDLAVAVCGNAELSPAEALASAQVLVDEHVRGIWAERAERAVARHSPFWIPAILTEQAVQRWLADLPVQQLMQRVDRDDRARVHEFGNSYQTTLWVAEDQSMVQKGEQRLRSELHKLEQSTAAKASGVAVGWVVLAILLGWLDRLSRGYMTGRLRAIGFLGGLLMPAVLFLV